MNKIKLNNTEFEIENYNKNTYFNDGNITSNANCTIIVSDMATLNALASDPITSIQIYHDDNLIYNLANIDAEIENITEWLNFDKMSIGINIKFNT